MEEKLDLIIQKLDELLYLAKRIHKDTEPSTENNASEYLLNVLGDVIFLCRDSLEDNNVWGGSSLGS